jgi:hypothetical protein
MFVPVACPQCGKPFQAAADAAGRSVVCPWCRAAVPGLPVASPSAEVLSLDDEEPAGLHPRLARRPRARTIVAVVLGVAVLTFAVLRVGKLFDADWTEFTPPDGSCRVLLPARPMIAEAVAANPHSPTVRGGERFVARKWSLKFVASLGWADLDPERAKAVRAEDLIAAEVRRRCDDLKAAAGRPAPCRVDDFQGAEVTYDTPAGTRVELLLVVPTGPRPRLYVLAVEGKDVKADDPVVRRFFNSFRVN